MVALHYRGHRFEAFKSEEAICRACGFVTGRDPSPAHIEELFRRAGIEDAECPKRWHGFRYRVPAAAAG